MTTDVPSLRGAQRAIRESVFAHDAGLFVLDCKPGFGKSTTVKQVAAEAMVRADAAGERCPERRLAVLSFSRDDAAGLEPGISAAIRAFAGDGETPVDVDTETADRLRRRLRHAEHVGTIDSVLRGVFADLATAVGFDAMPTVGNHALVTGLRADCVASLRADDDYDEAFATLDAAYPDAEGESGVDDLLETARAAKRDGRLSIEGVRDRLEATVADAYPDGPPATFEDVLADVARFYDDETARSFESRCDDAASVVDGDRSRHDAWTDCIEQFCRVLEAYETAYDAACRDRGVVSHTDVAHWVAAFFEGEAGADAPAAFRERVRDRYAAQFETVIVDEAQDVSVVQHDALAPLVSDDSRVLLAGDADQCIYAWRNASPALFARAFDDGAYFGVDWGVHETAEADRTYRMRPDIAGVVDAVFDGVFTDPARGARARRDGYQPLDATRDAASDPTVHVAGYRPNGERPGSKAWFEREARVLANYLDGALADGTFEIDGGACETVTVLFPRRTHMATLAAALRQRGRSVADASRHLFDHPLVECVCAVVRWLVDPYDPARTATLVRDDAVALPEDVVSRFAAADYRIEAVAAETPNKFAAGLAALAERRPRHASESGASLVEDAVDTLALSTDPLDQTTDPHRRLAALDALVEQVAEWEGDDRYAVTELAAVLEQYRATPSDGPTGPVPSADGYDFVFRTIHNMKGDEDGVVCLADLGGPVDAFGPGDATFLDRGGTLALAPPATVSRTPVVRSSARAPGDGGQPLRWATDHWLDDRLAGPPSLRDAGLAHRAGRWRLLYVAMSRARDHLVLSLPTGGVRRPPRTSWAATLSAALGLGDAPARGRHEVSVSAEGGERQIAVDVNDVPLEGGARDETTAPTPRAALPPEPQQTGWTPRYVNGSTLYPLASDPAKHRLSYLQGRPLHADRPAVDADVPLALDSLGPETVGHVAHTVLTTAVDRGVATADLRACSGGLGSVLNESIREHTRGVDGPEREALRGYVSERLCPQFATTDAWDRLRGSSERYVEEPLDAVVDVGSVAIETRNRADVVSVAPDGTWHVDDLKVVLADVDPAVRGRYELQVAFYAWLLDRQLPPDSDVTATLTSLGVEVGSAEAHPPVVTVPEWLDRLVD